MDSRLCHFMFVSASRNLILSIMHRRSSKHEGERGPAFHKGVTDLPPNSDPFKMKGNVVHVHH